MLEKEYIYIFIVCVYLFNGIIATFLEEDMGESLDILVREKRVINRKPGKDVPVNVGAVPYAVSIKKYNRLHCMGAILSQHTAITAARCVDLERSMYTVLSGSTYKHQGTSHNITGIKMRGNSPSRSSTFSTGIALMTVDPPFVYKMSTDAIDLHTGPIVANVRGIISGFGAYTYAGRRCETQHTIRLRSIIVPIMNHRDCVNIYRGHFPIEEEDVCTYHPQKECALTDAGAPLVVDRLLVGIHIGEIDTTKEEIPVKPDVFLLLQHLHYGPWIRENIVH